MRAIAKDLERPTAFASHNLRIPLILSLSEAPWGKQNGVKAMSNDINVFLQSMVEAKAALDQMPGLKAEIEQLRRQNHIQGDTIANRELHIHSLKKDVTDLTQKLRSVEAERDDAGFRALEEQDKVQNLLSHLQQFVSDSLKTIAAVTGGEAMVVVKESEKQELDGLRGAHLVDLRTIELKDELITRQQDSLSEYQAKLMEAEREKAQLNIKLAEATQPGHPFREEPNPTGVATASTLYPESSERAADPTPPLSSPTTEDSGASNAESTSTEGVSVPSDPTAGPVGPLPTGPEATEQSSGGTGQSPESTSETEHRRVFEQEFRPTEGEEWPIPSRASHFS
jgi:hypothetical protein